MCIVPYINEYADKTSHSDIINNPEVIEFLDKCSFMIPPNEETINVFKNKFIDIPKSEFSLPENIIAIDGSYYEANIKKDIPCTKIGYVKVGSLLIKRGEFLKLGSTNSKFIDPFKVAKLKENNLATTFTFPTSNIKYKKETNVRDSFRLALDEQLLKVRSIESKPSSSLRSTLFKLASFRDNEDEEDCSKLTIHKCPNCDHKNIVVYDIEEQQYCPECEGKVYPSDCLRIWEELSESTSSKSALTRFMNVIEHLFVIHYIRCVVDSQPQSFANILDNIAFFVDGPLAIFGNSAWIHSCIMKYLSKINTVMRAHEKKDIMIIGLLKSGYLCDYFNLTSDSINKNTIYAVEDSYRYSQIIFDRNPSGSTFGFETYYGQDFLFKTSTGRTFVFNIPYPFEDKTNKKEVFTQEKVDIKNYSNLAVYTGLIQDFEYDLYENAVIPIALAHKYTSISLQPGSQILDLLSKENIKV